MKNIIADVWAHIDPGQNVSKSWKKGSFTLLFPDFQQKKIGIQNILLTFINYSLYKKDMGFWSKLIKDIARLLDENSERQPAPVPVKNNQSGRPFPKLPTRR